jgi:hypothetical protein
MSPEFPFLAASAVLHVRTDANASRGGFLVNLAAF